MATAWTLVQVSEGSIRGRLQVDPGDVGKELEVRISWADGSYPVRGFNGVEAGSGVVVMDHEAPLNRALQLQAWLDGELVASAPCRVSSPYPLISDPWRGQHVAVTIASWPDRAYERRGQVVDVEDATVPLVIEGREKAPTSQLRLIHNLTAGSADALAEMLSAGSVVRIRPSGAHLEAAWVSARDRDRRRFSTRPDSVWTDTIELQHLGMPEPGVAAIGDTLGDLADAVPGTLADIVARWPGVLVDLVLDGVGA